MPGILYNRAKMVVDNMTGEYTIEEFLKKIKKLHGPISEYRYIAAHTKLLKEGYIIQANQNKWPKSYRKGEEE